MASLSPSTGPISFPSASPTTPLLTRFTPPPDCRTTYWENPPYGSSIITAGYVVNPTSCQLQGFVGPLTASTPILFSPGVCIEGYTPASTFLLGAATISVCCHEGLQYQTSGKWRSECANTVSSSGVTVFRYSGDTTTHTVVNSFYLVDTPYTVAWASTDLDSFTPASLPLKIAKETGTPASSSLGPGTSRTVGAPVVSSSPPSPGLSRGAQAGIGAAAAAVGIALGALLMWYFIRRRSRRQTKLLEIEGTIGGDAKDVAGSLDLLAPKKWVEVAAEEKPIEMLGDVGHEFPEDKGAREADNDMRHELDANYRGEELTDIATPVDESPATGIN